VKRSAASPPTPFVASSTIEKAHPDVFICCCKLLEEWSSDAIPRAGRFDFQEHLIIMTSNRFEGDRERWWWARFESPGAAAEETQVNNRFRSLVEMKAEAIFLPPLNSSTVSTKIIVFRQLSRDESRDREIMPA